MPHTVVALANGEIMKAPDEYMWKKPHFEHLTGKYSVYVNI